MSQQERFERVVASLREAQLDDARWPSASALVDDACGMLGNHLAIIRGDNRDNAEFLFGKLYKRGEPDEELEQLYIKDHFASDERIPRFFRMPDSQLRHVTAMFTDEELATSPTYNDFLVPTGAGNSLNVRMAGPGGLHIVMSLVRSGNPSGWTAERVGMVQQLLPHIRHFVRFRQALADAGTGAIWATAAALGAKNIGIVLLDWQGRIAEANDHARALLRADDGLTSQGGYLTARHAADADALARLLGAALRRTVSDARGGTIPVRRTFRPSLTLHVSPLSTDSRADFGVMGSFAAMVLIVDPLGEPNVDEVRVAQALELTPAQARVAAALASGGTVRSIALASNRSEAAVRWHLRQMMTRFELSRQTDLVRLVLTTPGVFDR